MIDSTAEDGQGDLYRYKFEPHAERMLSARFAGNRPTAMIQWGGGFVDSTNRVGCSASPAARGAHASGLALLALMLLVVWGLRPQAPS
jgi:hypothetical protein